MKAYLGIRDPWLPYAPDRAADSDTLFGIDIKERNFARVHVSN